MSEVDSLSPSAKSLQADVRVFLDADREIEATEQMDFMAGLLSEFDQMLPVIGARLSERLARNAELYPGLRIRPTILPKAITARPGLVRPRLQSPAAEIMRAHAKLATPPDFSLEVCEEGDKLSKLWNGKDEIMHLNDLSINRQRDENEGFVLKPHALRYKGPSGSWLNREAYFEALLNGGHAIPGENSSVWTFPMVDPAHILPDRVYKNPNDALNRLDYTASPEARLGTQILHLLTGNALHEDVVEVSNEIISEIDSNKEHQRTVGIVGITRSEPDKFFRLGAWSTLALPDWQSSAVVNGLGDHS